MNRQEWLKEKRRLAELRYDIIFSVDYDEKWENIGEIHKKNLLYFLSLLHKGTTILDAGCGTGKYWGIIKENGYNVLGIDQSQQMLNKAASKFPDVEVRKIGLQEMDYTNAFDGIICIDAMENVFPEDWKLVLNNFHRALKNGGVLYFTVEVIDQKELLEAYKKGIKLGLPLVKGEIAHKGGYHFYPKIDEVKGWLNITGFTVEREDISEGYHHFIVWE